MTKTRRNSTEIPSQLAEKIAALVAPEGTGRYTLSLRNRDRDSVSGRYLTRKHDVLINVPAVEVSYVARPREGKGYLHGYALGSRAEAFVFVLAHELRHRWQAGHLSPKVYGSKGRYSERDADAYALSVLRKMRRGEIAGLNALVAKLPRGITPEAAASAQSEREAKRAAKRVTERNDPLRDLPASVRKHCPKGTTLQGGDVFAPRGYIWAISETHFLCSDWTEREGREALIEDLRGGIEKCPNGAECEWCNDESEG